MKYERYSEIIANMNRWNMEIIDSGYVCLDPGSWHADAVCSPFSRLYLIADGEGQIVVGGEKIMLRPGTAWFIPAGLIFDHSCDVYLEKLYFHLRLVRPDGYDLAQGLSFAASCPFDKKRIENMRAWYRGNLWKDVFSLEQEIRSVTFELLCQYDVLQKSLTSYSPLVEEAMRYIHAHLSAGLTAKQIADALFTSDITLSRRFRKETGRTIHQYLEDMVFQAACKKLAISGQPLGEISEELGFCDPFYFSRRFSQRYGEPPSQYRKRLKLYPAEAAKGENTLLS